MFGKFKKIDLKSINDFVIYLATPCLILSSLTKDPIEISLILKMFLGVILLILISLAVIYPIVRYLKLSVKIYVPPVLFANTGNMGLPLVLFAFGEVGFTIGILYMASTTILHYSLGISILNYDKNRFELFKLPLIYSALLGIYLNISNTDMPLILDRSVDLLGQASIPVMIFALGYKLCELKWINFRLSVLFGGARIFFGLVIGILIHYLLDFDEITANVFILQAAMPPAIFNFVLAEKYLKDSQTVASVILAGTVISIITTPIILSLLLD